MSPLVLADGTRWNPLRVKASSRGPAAAIYPVKFLKAARGARHYERAVPRTIGRPRDSIFRTVMRPGLGRVLGPVPAGRAGGDEVASRDEAIAAYGRVLERFVNERGAVDFEALARNRADLDTYVRFIAATPLESFTEGDERLAHYINSYNALSMFNVIESGIPKSHRGWRKIAFFVLRRFDVGGRRLSLYSYENDFIRKVGDARIHFALNCSAIGCPHLPRIPFRPAHLQDELDRVARRFFASPEHLLVDRPGKTVYVSELLKFYRKDFLAHAPSLLAFVNRYAPKPVPEDYEVRFIPYDWTIANSRPT